MGNTNTPQARDIPELPCYKPYNPELVDGQIPTPYKAYQPDIHTNEETPNDDETPIPPLIIDEEAVRDFRAIWARPPRPANPTDYMYKRHRVHPARALRSNDRAYELLIGVGPASVPTKQKHKQTAFKDKQGEIRSRWSSSSSSSESGGDIVHAANTWALILRPVNTHNATWYLTAPDGNDGYERLVLERPFPNTHFGEAKALKLGIINAKDKRVFVEACAKEQSKECRAFILGIVNKLADCCLVEQLARGAVGRLDRLTAGEGAYDAADEDEDEHLDVGEDVIIGLEKRFATLCQQEP
ncbi:uncharacterized protein DSM5745_08512 [Aspergillus mulundensis]|uniref:Uncharacterized protein n=1 Tax=Aspergillus mulundensis TaxID=1810919 RepID=A0A3D8R3W6_9EURO|nr:hypothetical protein DSM5745_08512 [Aspergillus mulundensis]RDW68752.1 hypothetical protein DSM5745_08512 [Aspergillus mulundensis]